MAYVIPNTTCNLYSGIEVIPGEQNLFASTEANKIAYFNNHLVSSYVQMTYQRRGLGRIRLEQSIATVRRCNYISFVNTNHENVVFYCYIFDYEYINEGCTEVSYIVDEWLTNCHNADLKFNDCIIEREHNNLAEYNAERANPYRNDMPSLKVEEPMTVGKLDELPTVLPIVNIMESGQSLDSEYSYTYSGPFSRLSNTTDYPSGQNMCYVIMFGGQLEPEQSKAVVRCADYLHAPEDYTKNVTNFERYWNQMPEIFKMFTDFDIPRLRDNVVSPFYIGIYDMVQGNDEEHEEGFKGSDIVDILNWFTLNDAVNTIIGIYMMPRYMCTWDYGVRTTADNIGTEYTIGLNGKGCYVASGLNASLPEVVNSQYLMGDDNEYDAYNIYMPLPTKEVENYKLKRFPYSYIRAIAPDETTKEFYYEEFFDIANAQSVDFTKNSINGQPNSKPAKFRCVTNLNGQPTLSLVPHNYKQKGTVPNPGGVIGLLSSDLYGLNESEKLEFTKYPQLGFMSDGYVSYLAAQYNRANEAKSVEAKAAYNHELTNRRLSNTKSVANDVGDIVSGASQIGTFNSAGQTGAGVRQISAGLSNLSGTVENIRYTEEANEIYKQRMAEADMRGNFNGNIYDTLYNGTKPTFVGDSYNKGDTFGYGMYQFLNINAGVMGFTVQVVELKPNVLALYDNFLTNYGYAVYRIGLPHVYEALKGMVGKTLKFNSKNFVYVKTSECKVSGLMYESCSKIADMFNNGIKFINIDPS